MAQKLIRVVKVRVYKGRQKLFDQKGKQINESQLITYFHGSREWDNFKKYFHSNKWLSVEVSKCINNANGNDVAYEDITKELLKLTEAKKSELSTEEKLAELTKKIESMPVEPNGKTDEEVEQAIKEAVDALVKEKDEKIQQGVLDLNDKDTQIEQLKKQLEEANKTQKDGPVAKKPVAKAKK